MDKVNHNCTICSSHNITKINTYKHLACICNDCNNVFHKRKDKYLLEYMIPRALAKRLLPHKAFLRLFSDVRNSSAPDFYDKEAFDSTDHTSWRISEAQQVHDQLAIAGFSLNDVRILDISGGPGYVAKSLVESGAQVVVTEYSSSAVNAMRKQLNLDSFVFDYVNDDISSVVDGKFDLIMIRSSIIFCPDLDLLISKLRSMISPTGAILLESILPSYGEIFWWQQLEYKFPYIYSQETIEKVFYKNGFNLKYAYRDYGNYYGVKIRSYNNFSRHIFTWLIEFPMILLYRVLNIHKKSSIDSTMNHKMITQFWTLQNVDECKYKNFSQGGYNKSKTFGYKYNGYLKKHY